jgi:hypothetical protein
MKFVEDRTAAANKDFLYSNRSSWAENLGWIAKCAARRKNSARSKRMRSASGLRMIYAWRITGCLPRKNGWR